MATETQSPSVVISWRPLANKMKAQGSPPGSAGSCTNYDVPHAIYRSTSPISTSSPPEPLAIVPASQTYYVDNNDVQYNVTYYYRVSELLYGGEKFTDEPIKIRTERRILHPDADKMAAALFSRNNVQKAINHSNMENLGTGVTETPYQASLNLFFGSDEQYKDLNGITNFKGRMKDEFFDYDQAKFTPEFINDATRWIDVPNSWNWTGDPDDGVRWLLYYKNDILILGRIHSSQQFKNTSIPRYDSCGVGTGKLFENDNLIGLGHTKRDYKREDYPNPVFSNGNAFDYDMYGANIRHIWWRAFHENVREIPTDQRRQEWHNFWTSSGRWESECIDEWYNEEWSSYSGTSMATHESEYYAMISWYDATWNSLKDYTFSEVKDLFAEISSWYNFNITHFSGNSMSSLQSTFEAHKEWYSINSTLNGKTFNESYIDFKNHLEWWDHNSGVELIRGMAFENTYNIYLEHKDWYTTNSTYFTNPLIRTFTEYNAHYNWYNTNNINTLEGISLDNSYDEYLYHQDWYNVANRTLFSSQTINNTYEIMQKHQEWYDSNEAEIDSYIMELDGVVGTSNENFKRSYEIYDDMVDWYDYANPTGAFNSNFLVYKDNKKWYEYNKAEIGVPFKQSHPEYLNHKEWYEYGTNSTLLGVSFYESYTMYLNMKGWYTTFDIASTYPSKSFNELVPEFMTYLSGT